MGMFRLIDWPPVWTLGAIIVSTALARVAPVPLLDLLFSGVLLRPLGILVGGASLLLAVWSAATMMMARTTVIPRRAPSALVTHGPFRFSRNPIYLADLGFLAAAGLFVGSLWPILGVLPLAWVLTRRFIHPEEEALKAAYPENWRQWASATGRWL